MLLYKEFTFDSAHFLPNVPVGHKCKEMHGHTYRLRVWLEGPLLPELGWVMDFADLKAVVKPVVERLDHKCLNNIVGLETRPVSRLQCISGIMLNPGYRF